jgi:hypothetical protein
MPPCKPSVILLQFGVKVPIPNEPETKTKQKTNGRTMEVYSIDHPHPNGVDVHFW